MSSCASETTGKSPNNITTIHSLNCLLYTSGYKTQTITTGVQNSYQIVLKEDTEVLDEVVVTGYGGSQNVRL